MSEPTFRVRAARPDDLEAFHALALKTGGGFTNLPADRAGLAQRLARSAASFAEPDHPTPLFLLALEAVETGEAVGTAALFPRIGVEWPFYSYRRVRLSQASAGLGKTMRTDMLHLVNDFDGCAEVGALFVDPAWRRARSGRLLARSRYLFIAALRERFADCVIADLRGWQDEGGRSPVWEGLGRHFFDMPFEEADRFNSLTGNQFIADLMPKHPVYVTLLPPDAQAAIGRPHAAGEPAHRLLVEEGFRDDGYVDIFDAGPTLHAQVSELKAVRDSRLAPVIAIADAPEGDEAAEPALALVSAGAGARFRAAVGRLRAAPDGVILPNALAAALQVQVGDTVRHVSF